MLTKMTKYFNHTPTDDEFLRAVVKELRAARTMYPAPNANFVSMQEEVGEVSKAVMCEAWPEVVNEAVQAVSAIIRLVTEGDVTLLEWRAYACSKSDYKDMPVAGVSEQQVYRRLATNVFTREA